MTNLRCTNPRCQAQIEIPPGVTQVICPQCNTWYLVDPGAQDNPVNPTGQYQVPTLTRNPASPPPQAPVYDPFAYAPAEPVSQAGAAPVEKAAPPSPGWLESPDGHRYPLEIGVNIIGRKNCSIEIHHPTISREHCVIEVQPLPEGGGFQYLIYDIGNLRGSGSTNGVFLSGRSLRLQNSERIPISTGASFKLGIMILKLVSQ